MRPNPSIRQRVDQLAAAGQVAAAAQLLEQEAAGGDADALFALGAWLDSGQHLPRDRARARDCFVKAAKAGHPQADTIFTNFLANGAGGQRDWQGALTRLRARAKSDRRAEFELGLIERMNLDEQGAPTRLPQGEQRSESPWVRTYPQLFSEAESAFLAAAAAPFLQPATVVDNVSGKPIRNPIRTSHAALLTPPLESPAVHALNRRLAAVTGTDVAQGEPLQVLRYLSGQEYKAHIDAIPSLENQRVLTASVYLNADYVGGETRFIASGLSVRGKAGEALVFRNVDAAGGPDKQAAHCGMPVTSGVKLLASRWIRERPFAAD